MKAILEFLSVEVGWVLLETLNALNSECVMLVFFRDLVRCFVYSLNYMAIVT